MRVYHQAGFELHPQMYLTGTIARSVLPVVEKVRDGSAADVDLMDSLDRSTRGAGHGPDHELMLSMWRLLVSDTTTGASRGRRTAWTSRSGRAGDIIQS